MNDYSTLTIEQINAALNGLYFAEKSFILSHTDVEKQRELLMNTKNKKILETYPIRIWQTSNGTWKAHVPDDTKDRGRKILQGKTKENLENTILNDYAKRFDDRLVFSNYFANWLVNYKAKLVQPATIQRNYDDYRKYIQGTVLDKTKITAIKRSDIKELLNSIINKHHLTRKSLNNIKSIFNGLYAYAIDNEDVTINPMLNLKIENTNIMPEKVKEAETEVFNEQELDLLIEYLYNNYTENRPVVTLAILLNFQLGLRVAELCTIKKSDIDFKRQKIRIDRIERSYRPISLVNGKIVEEKTIHEVMDGRTKKDSNRILDLSDEAMAIINQAINLQKELSIKSEYLFADENGNNIIRQRINDCLRFYCKKLAMECKSSHKIRKTVLSNLFANGFDFDEVMEIAGHRQKTTTLKYYLFSMKLKDDRKERLNKALASKHCIFSQPNANPKRTA